MNTNGWKFTLKIEQNDDTVTGTMTGINNDQTSKIEGKVNGNKITFARVGEGQEYEGYLLNDDPTKKGNNHAVAGIAKNGRRKFRLVRNAVESLAPIVFGPQPTGLAVAQSRLDQGAADRRRRRLRRRIQVAQCRRR